MMDQTEVRILISQHAKTLAYWLDTNSADAKSVRQKLDRIKELADCLVDPEPEQNTET